MTVIEKLQMNVNQANSDFVAIKNKIVEKGVEVADGTRTAEYVVKVDEVYEAGKKSQYNEFWDSSKNVLSWAYRFAGACWNATTFKPNFDLILKGNVFGCFYGNNAQIDLVERLEELGITMSISEATNIGQLFCYSHFTRVGIIDARNASGDSIFRYMLYIKKIDKLIVSEKTNVTNAFSNDYNLENLIIEGTIAQNGFDVQWSTKLSKASWISIINALSETTSGLSITGSLESVNTAFETSAGAKDGSTSAEWLNLIATKSNWTVNLVL